MTTAVRAESAKLHAGVVLAAPGFGESSTDATYSGLCLIAEDGKVLESAEDGCSDIVTELDVQLLIAARRKDATFTGDASDLARLVRAQMKSCGGKPPSSAFPAAWTPRSPSSSAPRP